MMNTPQELRAEIERLRDALAEIMWMYEQVQDRRDESIAHCARDIWDVAREALGTNQTTQEQHDGTF